MKYMGSKKRLQKDITPLLNKIIEKKGIKKYVEPFVGGANMIESIKCENRIGYDNNKYLIAILDYVSNNGFDNLPSRIERNHYVDVRNSFNKQDGKYEDYQWVNT
jgi:DNA adenine methylase